MKLPTLPPAVLIPLLAIVPGGLVVAAALGLRRLYRARQKAETPPPPPS